MNGFADADGLRIGFTDHGGEGRALILVHATGFHRHVWDPFLPALTPRFRVVTIDQRGHGESDKPSSGYRWENFGLDVLAVIDHLGLRQPFAAGHSSGGAALVLAEAHRPGSFGRLVLFDPVVPDPDMRPFMTGDANPMAGSARKRRAVWDSADQMIERFQANSPMARWRPDFLRAYVEHGTRERPDGTRELICPPEIEAQVYENNGRHRGWEALPTLRCPVLLLVGAHSYMWPEAKREALAGQIHQGRLEVVPGGAHFFPMESPDATLKLVLEELSGT